MAEKARTPMARVVSRQTIVRTAEDFAKTGADACPGIQFIHVSKTEVEESMGDLDDLAFSGARHLPGIRNVHHMEVCLDHVLSSPFYIQFAINDSTEQYQNISRCLVKIRSRCSHSRAPLQARSTDSSVIICTIFGPI